MYICSDMLQQSRSKYQEMVLVVILVILTNDSYLLIPVIRKDLFTDSSVTLLILNHFNTKT